MRLFWWTSGESNPRPLQCECSALPSELLARTSVLTSSDLNVPRETMVVWSPDHERSEASADSEVEWCPQRESNPHLALRTGQLYPLSYVGRQCLPLHRILLTDLRPSVVKRLAYPLAPA